MGICVSISLRYANQGPSTAVASSSEEAIEDYDTSRDDAPLRRLFIVPSAFLALAVFLKEATLKTPRSSYICTSATSVRLVIPAVQILAMLWEGFIVAKVSTSVCGHGHRAPRKNIAQAVVIARIFIVSEVQKTFSL